MTHALQPRPEVSFDELGADGNAFAIMGVVTRHLRAAGASADYIHQYQQESMSSDYDGLLKVAMRYVEVT